MEHRLMTAEEFRKSSEYEKCKEIIKGYAVGKRFTIHFAKMSEAQKRAMDILTKDCMKEGIIDVIHIDIDLGMNITEEEYERI